MHYDIPSNRIRQRRRFRAFGIERLMHCIVEAKLGPATEAYRAARVDIDTLLERLSRKRLVFTVTAGRTGSAYLAQLFAVLPDTVSLHEPQPAFHRWLRRVQREAGAAKEFLVRYKLPFIAALPEKQYVETSQVFCKGFLEPLLGLGLRPDLILLRREPRRVAISNLARYAVPGRTRVGFEWLLQPNDPDVLPLPGWRKLSDYQLCFWYALENERRQRIYGRAIKALGGRVCDLTALELNDPDRFLRAIRELDLDSRSIDDRELRRRHGEASAQDHNRNPFPLHLDGDLEAEEEQVWGLVEGFEPNLRGAVTARYRQGPDPAATERRASANHVGHLRRADDRYGAKIKADRS